MTTYLILVERIRFDMVMDMSCIYVSMLLVLYVHFSAGQQYYISKDKASAENAATLCKLATPQIEFFRSGRNTEISGLDTDGPVWVGYATTYKTFWYKGCANIKQLKTNTTGYTLTNPGECYAFCQTPFVGMLNTANKPTCYCINDIEASTNLEAYCKTQCENMQVLCGNGISQESVSVYKHVLLNVSGASYTSGDKEGSKCLAYRPGDSFFWSTCKRNYKKQCTGSDYLNPVGNGYGLAFGVFNDPPSAAKINSTGTEYNLLDFLRLIRFNWIEAMTRCERSSRQLDDVLSTLFGLLTINDPTWTEFVRSFSIIKSSVTLDEDYVRQGYIQRVNGKYGLHFADEQIQMQALCIAAPTTIETTTGKTTVQRASSDSNLPTGTPTTNGADANSTESIHIDIDKDELLDGVPNIVVYAVSPTVLVVAAVVIGLLVWRMKKRRPKPDIDPDRCAYFVNTTDKTRHGEVNQTNIGHYETRLQDGRKEHQYSDLAQAAENNDLSNIYEVVF